ncbi:MAG: VOC family protein [Alphaproteobacteria bacterium]|nr:VOC family protein [Alphaproteobacteria bacterium]MBU1516059.1 VOC family protein [Alphaproteobacteria bacterium]MBU2092726.1 VOC family protein [Alphaproteobacteria bacterium]MBU2153749.1 VOC family protein [Alphaproteobacteria bacterium]MBU2308377.1 VOC family protein [Alphaproteobacteria bacterium]
MRLRQIALVGQDLEAARAEIVEVLGLGADYADPGVHKYGLHNAVWPVGDTFLEVVSPNQEGTTAGRLLEKRQGDGGYMVILQTEDLAGARARLADKGVRIADQFDGDGVHFTHLHPKDVGGAIVSVDHMVPRERWQWGGPDWQANVRTETSLDIVGAEVQAADPAAMARRWGEVLGLAARPDGLSLALEGGEIRFVPALDGRGDGLRAFYVKVRDPAVVYARAQARGTLNAAGEITLCGTQVRLVKG